MGLLGDIGNFASDAVDTAGDLLDKAVDSSNAQYRSFESNGFIVPPIPSPSGQGLPSSKTPFQNQHRNIRDIIHWFVPEVGTINMYINPQRMDYKYSKLIQNERTKGGFIVQYWGENLPVISISGHTGSSGIEGINVLYEIYRAEQINFDPIALTMASTSAGSGVNDLISSIGESIGGIGGSIFDSVSQGVMGLNPLTKSILPRNPSTLSSLALGVEMYYSGKVYRGYFTSFNVHESSDQIGMFNYDIEFVVTQQRGYRLNTMPWHRSATSGPSNNSEGGVPLSFGHGLSFATNTTNEDD